MIIDKDLQDCVILKYMSIAQRILYFSAFKAALVETRPWCRIYKIERRYDCEVIECVLGDILVKDGVGFESIFHYIAVANNRKISLLREMEEVTDKSIQNRIAGLVEAISVPGGIMVVDVESEEES